MDKTKMKGLTLGCVNTMMNGKQLLTEKITNKKKEKKRKRKRPRYEFS